MNKVYRRAKELGTTEWKWEWAWEDQPNIWTTCPEPPDGVNIWHVDGVWSVKGDD